MNESIGSKLKKQRLLLGINLKVISEQLKIRVDYLEAIESDDYTIFTSDIYAKGFIKNYAKYLGLNSDSFVASYRRDVEKVNLDVKKQTNLNKSSSKKGSLKINTKLLFIFCSTFIIILTVLLFIQKAFEAPSLEIYNPTYINSSGTYSASTKEKTVVINGKLNSNSLLKINGEIISLNPDFSFKSDIIPITQDLTPVVIEAISNVGSVNKVIINIERDLALQTEQSGINGIIQIIKDRALLNIKVDNKDLVSETFFENDSYPIIAKQSVEIQSEDKNNIKIFINGLEYKILENKLFAEIKDDKLVVNY